MNEYEKSIYAIIRILIDRSDGIIKRLKKDKRVSLAFNNKKLLKDKIVQLTIEIKNEEPWIK